MRVLTERLSTRWQQPVVVDNRPGASGTLATAAVARAEPSGHTLFLAQTTHLALNEYLMPNLPFSAERDLLPLVWVVSTPFIVCARPDLPASNLAELMVLARKGNELTFATSGATTLPRFTGERLARVGGFRMMNISYTTGPAALQDTSAGRTDLVVGAPAAIVPQVRAGRLKAICMTSARRFPGIEDVPATAETLPGFALVGWIGLVGPAGMPSEIAERIAADVTAVLQLPEIGERLLRDLGAEPVGGTPTDFAAYVAEQRESYRQLARELNLVVE
jgi:tripartite-type tricarboxylate transporter receptor subunit TctC